MDSKVCSKCKVEKPASLFHKRADRPCGLYPSCKECVKAKPSNSKEASAKRVANWVKNNPEKRESTLEKFKAKNPEYSKNHQQKRRLNPDVVLKEREAERARYAANPQAHIEKVKAWKAANPEKAKAIRQKHWDDNPGARNAARMKRHAAKLQATPSWANSKQIVKIYEEAKIKSIQTGEVWHVDHVYPLQSDLVCGLHVEYNLAVITKPDNLSKGNRLIT
jgi:hypothetical protein